MPIFRTSPPTHRPSRAETGFEPKARVNNNVVGSIVPLFPSYILPNTTRPLDFEDGLVQASLLLEDVWKLEKLRTPAFQLFSF